jgi:hypothetical protein
VAKLDIHGCVDCVREHFYSADYLHLLYTRPVEAYQLNGLLNFRLCDAWNRFEKAKTPLTPRECVLLSEAWLASAPDHTKPMHVNAAWVPKCSRCGEPFHFHNSHPGNNPKGEPPDRWLCADDGLYVPIEYPLPFSGEHPRP